MSWLANPKALEEECRPGPEIRFIRGRLLLVLFLWLFFGEFYFAGLEASVPGQLQASLPRALSHASPKIKLIRS